MRNSKVQKTVATIQKQDDIQQANRRWQLLGEWVRQQRSKATYTSFLTIRFLLLLFIV